MIWYVYPVWALFSLHPYIFWIEILLFIEYDDAICMIIIAEPLLLSREQCFSLFGTKGETYIWQYLLCYRVVVRHVRFVDCWVLWLETCPPFFAPETHQKDATNAVFDFFNAKIYMVLTHIVYPNEPNMVTNGSWHL